MKLKIAKLLSFIFHPVVFTLLIPFLVAYHNSSDFSNGIKWAIFTACFIFASMFVFFLFKPIEFLKDVDISKKELRPLFYAICLVFAIIYFLIAVIFKGIFSPLSIISLGVIVGIVFFELTTIFLKASIHTAVATSYIITIGVYYGFGAFLLTAWLPLAVGWSRLVLKRHTMSEAITGAILGSIVTLLTFAVGRLLV